MVANASTSPPSDANVGAAIREFQWEWQDTPVTIAYEVLGTGQPVLMLPAFSTVSSREEMRPLAHQLAAHYQVVLLDWPGFGDSSRSPLRYSPQLYRAALSSFVRSQFTDPVVVVAAGHAAGYVMELAHRNPVPWSWVVLTAPTWRGPLPTVFGDHRWAYRLIQQLVNFPVIGHFLYFLNTLPPFLGWMYRRHVYGDRQHITRPLMRQKWRTSQHWCGRFAPAAFVTGGLDPLRSRDAWVSEFQPLPVPVLMVIGDQMPRRSRAELEVVAHFSAVQVHRMPGALGLHEEYPDELAATILPFLQKYLSQRN